MKVLCFDMDNVLVDFESALKLQPQDVLDQYKGRYDEIPGIFSTMLPMPGAIEAYHKLSMLFDCYIISTAPWENHTAWADKNLWVRKYLGEVAWKRLTLTHHKNLIRGDYIIDDRTKNGVDKFVGEHIHFGTDKFKDWNDVLDYLVGKNANTI